MQICLGFFSYPWFQGFSDRYDDIFASHLALIAFNKITDLLYVGFLLAYAGLAFILLAFFHPELTKANSAFKLKTSFSVAVFPKGLSGNELVFSSVGACGLLASIFYLWHWFQLASLLFWGIPFLALLSLSWLRDKEWVLRKILMRAQAFTLLLLLRPLANTDAVASAALLSFAGAIWVLLVFLLFAVAFVTLLKGKPSALVMGAVAFWLAWPRLEAGVFSLDDYHLGEMLLPLNQFWDHGLRPFWQFVSVHGALAIIYGVITRFFYLNSYLSGAESVVLTKALVAFIWGASIGALFRRNFALVLFAIAPFCVPSWERYYFFPLLIFFLMYRGGFFLRRNPGLIVFCVLVLALINPITGIALFISLSLPLLILPERKAWATRSSIIYLLSAFFLALGLGPGFLQFVLENANGTQQAFGLPLPDRQSLPTGLRHLMGNPNYHWLDLGHRWLKLYGWLMALWIIPVFWRSGKESLFRFIFKRELIFFVLFVFSAVLLSYTFGRIGTDGFGRVGNLSILFLGIFLPLDLLRRSQIDPRLWKIIPCVLLTAFCLRAGLQWKEFRAPWLNLLPLVSADAATSKFGNLPERLRGLGVGQVPSHVVEELESFATGWEAVGRSDFIDFTNRQNFFFLTNTRVPQLYPSFLLAINETIQNRVIQRIEASKPLGVWIAPAHSHEAVPVSIRAYRIFRWFMESAPFASYHRESAHEFVRLNWLNGFQRNITARDLSLGAFTEIPRGLEFLPAVWGKNWPRLSWRFRTVEQGVFHRPELEIPLIKAGENLVADFLKLELPEGKSGAIELQILGENSVLLQSVSFELRAQNTYLLPVGGFSFAWHSQARSLRLVWRDQRTPFVSAPGTWVWLRLVN